MTRTTLIIPLIVLLFGWVSCESDKRYPPKGYLPNTPVATTQLQAEYFWTAQDKISSSYWKDANYVPLTLTNKLTGELYGDGILNSTGTYGGLASFNRGENPEATLKAGYDDEYLYVMLEWKDTTTNASYLSWLWQGVNDPLKQDDTLAWTSQQNSDNATLMFGTESGKIESAWKWSVAHTAPFNMAIDMTVTNGAPELPSQLPYSRNTIDETSNRSGPMYEWNDQRQEFTMADGSVRILDPAYYLADAYKVPIIGDAEKGANIFNSKADCKYCHGINGNGIPEGYTHGGPLQGAFINKYTRAGLVDYISSSAHEGAGFQYWGRIKNEPEDIKNLVSFMRANAGIPGILHVAPAIKTVSALSNFNPGGVNNKNSSYKVLFKRSLKASGNGSLIFSTNSVYRVQLRLSDNDDKNYIGSNEIDLVFGSDKL